MAGALFYFREDFSDIKPESDYITVLDNIFLSFQAQTAGGFHLCNRTVMGDKIRI